MKIILLMSGGLDSATLLYHLKRGNYVQAMYFDYGQTHIKELQSAKKICADAGVKLHECKLPSIFSCALTGSAKDIPDGDAVIVPNRNMVLISAATAYAVQNDFDGVAIGCNSDDGLDYPDCGRMFLSAMGKAMRFCHTHTIELMAPFVWESINKKGVVKLARELGVPIDKTWSCYKGGKEPCGKCAACQLRHEAMTGIYPSIPRVDNIPTPS